MKSIKTIVALVQIVLKYGVIITALIAGIQTVKDKLEESGLLSDENAVK